MKRVESGRIMVELVPPSRRSSLESQKRFVERIVHVLQGLPWVDLVNVPEIISENHAGSPFYEKLDASVFALRLKSSLNFPVAVNRVTVYQPAGAFEAWLDESKNAAKIDRFIFVGGNCSSNHYPGISVLKANQLAQKRGCVFGNIAIPGRAGELSRLMDKTRTGASFFTTQILFESGPVKQLLLAYQEACQNEGFEPAAFYLCFAPVTEALDLEYLAWLGARIPESVDARLRQHDAAAASVLLAQQLYADVLTFARDEKLRVPLNINVEPVSTHNLEWIEPMVRSLNGVRHKF